MLKDYTCKYEDQLNKAIMEKSYDAPLVDYIIDAWKSLEVVKQIKFKGYSYTEKESDIDINKHIFKREKNKKRKDKYDIKFVEDSRVGRLTVELEISMNEVDPTTGVSKQKVYPLKKSMLIPLMDDSGRFFIKGNHYYLIYQMLEKSTYTSSSSVTLKSLSGIGLYKPL
jgi:hypothetical protein